MLALFPTDLATFRVARLSERTLAAARAELEDWTSPGTGRWRASAAAELASREEVCDLTNALGAKDLGPRATYVRRRCDLLLERSKGQALVKKRLETQPFGDLEVRAAIEGGALGKDARELEAIARKIAKLAPTSTLVVDALWAAAEVSKLRPEVLYKEALVLSGWDPVLARRILHVYLDRNDLRAARPIISEALNEAPEDSYLCGVQGELLMDEGKYDPALVFLTKSCVSGRRRREGEVLTNTFPDMWSTLPKAKDKATKDAAVKCLKGE
jgi:hypothetical protein